MMNAMTTPVELRILMLEDSAADAELNVRMLRKAGLVFTSLRVETRDALIAALDDFMPDIILADYHLPGFDGLQALAIAREKSPHTPYIFVTGAMGEEHAVDSIKQGATDYVIKDRLNRLPAAVQRALEMQKLQQQRREAEAALLESEARFRNLVETTSDWIWEVDENTVYTYASPKIHGMLGYESAEIIGKTPFDLMPPDEAKRVAEVLTPQIAAHKIFINFENINLHKDGHPVILETSGVPIFDPQGKFCGYRGIDRDITERKKAQEKILRSEARLKEAQHIAMLGNWELDIPSSVLTWSDEIYRIFELDPKQFTASYAAFLDAIHPDDRALVNQAYTASLQNRVPYNIVHRLLMPDGRVKYVQEIGSSTYDEHGKPLRSIGTVQDITELKRAEAQILRLNRTLRTISTCNENLVHAGSEDQLLNDICRNIVMIGEHLLAWVVYPAAETEGPLRAVAHFGDEAAFKLHQALDLEPEHVRGCLVGVAMRERHAAICNRLQEMTEQGFASLAECGVSSILALPLINAQQLYGVLTVFSPMPDAFDAGEVRLMEELAADLAYGIEALRTIADRDRYLGQFSQAMKNTITAIARTLEMRDPYTAGHQQRVTALAIAIAKEMGLDATRIEGLYFGAMIHDIGKISVPAEILSKPGALSDLEYKLIQQHPMSGFNIVQGIEFPWPVAEMIAQHHERIDGTGYPKGLKNGEISIEARIIAVADVVEAMTTHRPYRPALGIAAALEEIEQNKGRRYDPAVVEACIRVVKQNDLKLPQL